MEKSIATEAAENDANFTARPYQDQLLEICLEKNTIIYLPTGAGKTFIALMAIKHFSNDLKKSLKDGGKRSVFLVNTVVLAHQQCNWIRKQTGLTTSVYTGDMNVDAWRRDRWVDEFENSQVIVATCQIVLDVIRHGYGTLNQFNLIIFDECHHARGNHCMHQLMSLYRVVPINQRPRIIGLTGMLITGVTKPNTVIQSIEALESTYHASVATVKTFGEFSNVLLYSTNPTERKILYSASYPLPITETINTMIRKLIENVKHWPVDQTRSKQTNDFKAKGELVNQYKVMNSLLSDFVYQLTDLGLYGGSIAIMSVIVELELKKRSAETTRKRYLIRELIRGAETIRSILVKEIDDDEEDSSTILTNSSNKMVVLLNFIKNYVQNNDCTNMKALIFVKRRHSAKCIYHVIKKYAALTDLPIVPDFMVGNNSTLPESIEAILDNKWNRQVVERFLKNKTNLIVASSVLEEGIDLQMCNLVLSYDAPETFRSYVQSKGRARMANSTYAIMVLNSQINALEISLREYEQIDRILKDYLIDKAIDRQPPTEAEIHREFANQQIPPFNTTKGATLEALSAVQLLNRYCNSLPNDTFTKSTIIWSNKILNGKYVVSLRLPMQSSIKHIITSDAFTSLKLAKRSAAFKACVQLYKNKELNENLMPITVNRLMSSLDTVYFSHWAEFRQEDPKKAGTEKMIRPKIIVSPDSMTACSPLSSDQCYLYVIQIGPGYEPDLMDESAVQFHKLLGSKNSFGILTSKPLPELGEMIFFPAYGSVTVKFLEEIELDVIKTDDIGLLRRFHNMVFKDILPLDKKFFTNDFDNMENSYFIVPCASNQIDWNVVKQFQQLPSFDDRNQNKYSKWIPSAADYLHKVVFPNYRADKEKRYIVVKVHEHLTPYSEFPSDSYENYAAYIEDKYQKTIINRDQFLIEVKIIPSTLNCLKVEQKSEVKVFATRGPEYLIPELCNNYKFPGDLWLKATLLPSVLHRLFYMLQAANIVYNISTMLDDVLYEDAIAPVIAKANRRIWRKDSSEEISARPIMIPNPDETVPVKVEKSDIVLYSSTIECPWGEIEEPCDLDRNLVQIFPFEIDYYYSFISQKMSDIQLSKEKSSNNIDLLLGNNNGNSLAICDATEEDKQKINLIDITLNSTVTGPRQCDILAAITTPASDDVFDFEQFEIVGEAIINLSTSLWLIQTHPDWHEGFLQKCRSKIVGNRNLCYCALNLNLGGIIKLFKFNPKNDWSPPLKCVPRQIQENMREVNITPHLLYQLTFSEVEIETGNVSPETLHNFVLKFLAQEDSNIDDSSMNNFLSIQHVDDITLARSLKAIIGASYMAIGIERSFQLLSLFNILPRKENIKTMLSNRFKSPRLDAYISNADIDLCLKNRKEVETTLQYTFNNSAFLLQALTHPSYPRNTFTDCYQQLAFIGEAVIDLLITTYIHERCPDMNSGQLGDLRHALTNNITMGCLCVRYNFQISILSQNAILDERINKFVAFQEHYKNEITDQVQLLIEESDVNMGEFIDIPKVLGDIFAAIIGAVFLDSGNNISVTWSLLYRLMKKELVKFMADVPMQVINRLETFKEANPKYDTPIIEDNIVMVTLRFTYKYEIMQVQGFGHNKEEAKKAAAKIALNKLTQ